MRAVILGGIASLMLFGTAAEAKDGLTRFLDGVFKKEAPQPASPARAAPVVPAAAPSPPVKTTKPKPRHAAPKERAPQQKSSEASKATEASKLNQAPAAPSSASEAIVRLNAHFNELDGLSARFVQSTNGANLQSGTFALRRPGHLRFAYIDPEGLEIVADGKNLAIRDSRLGTNDVYPVNKTPVRFLVSEGFDIERDTKLRGVRFQDNGTFVVEFEDKGMFGQSSIIELTYDWVADAVTRWTINDNQGFRTTVVLSDLVIRRKDDTR